MYHVDLGRFLQRDPAGYADGLNLYAYVRNNPLRFLDPLGLVARLASLFLDPIGGGGVVYEAARDLDTYRTPAGTHRFLIIVPDDPASTVPYLPVVNLGNGVSGTVVGAHNVDGRLTAQFFQEADVKAAREYFDPSTNVRWYRPDFSTEVSVTSTPKDKTSAQFISDLLTGIRNFEVNSDNSPITYPTAGLGTNSNNFTRSLIKSAGGIPNPNFNGLDYEGDPINPGYFRPSTKSPSRLFRIGPTNGRQRDFQQP